MRAFVGAAFAGAAGGPLLAALRLGAQAGCFTNDGLLRAIEHVLSPAAEAS